MNATTAKAVRRTLGLLAEVFLDKTPELERYNVIALYCIFAELQRVYVITNIKSELRGWFLDFESKRRSQEALQVRIKCDGVRVEWDDWHCDHKVAWSKGGATTVENGQVACPACNLAKGAD